MVAKSPDAFRTISEVAEDLDLPQHVLRFWETRFVQIKPLKRGGGRRYYRPDDVDLLRGIRFLLYGEGYTIRGVQRILKEQGPRFVIAAGRGEFAGIPGRRDDPPETPAEDEASEMEFAEPRRRVEPVFADGAKVSPPPSVQPPRVPDFDVEREDHDPDDEPEEPHQEAGSARRMAERLMGSRAEPPQAPGLSRDDAERLKATLVELLELKRVLDQAR
jgi:DNA-binding transcriptional MerR regulator